jgi:hypothetical protein
MHDLPPAIIRVLLFFAPLFSRPVFRQASLLFIGHILSKGRRTVADILRLIHRKNEKNFSKFHWVLSGAKWSTLKGSKILFQMILDLVPGQIVINIDTTIERRKGPKIHALSTQRDPVRSTHKRKVLTIGLNWLVCVVNIKLPFSSNYFALPFLSVLMAPKSPLSTSTNQKDLKGGVRHKKITEWASQVTSLFRKWAGNRGITIVADSAFSCFKLLYACSRNQISFISRIRLDARLYDFAPEVNAKSKKKRVAGKVLPKLSELAKKNIKEWKEVEVDWYSGTRKRLFIQSGKSLWYYVGFKPVPIHWVLIKENVNSEPTALFSNNLSHSPEEIISYYVRRWPIETTFEEGRRHLGIETQRQWSDNAILRTTPTIFASYSIIILMAHELWRTSGQEIPTQKTTWYQKDHVTFSDLLAFVREPILRAKYGSLVSKKRDRSDWDIEDLILEAAAA